mgnify:CR=1 FL=1
MSAASACDEYGCVTSFIGRACSERSLSFRCSGCFRQGSKSAYCRNFYSAPSPNDKPFVTVGQQIKKGDTIFIIESMKVMSEVQSEFDGVVKEILVSDGDALEFDQTVMIIG